MKKLGLAFSLWALTIISGLGQGSSLAQWAEFRDSVEKQLKSKDFTVQLATIEKFATEDNFDAAEYLVKLVQKGREHPTVLKEAANVLGNYRSEGAMRAVGDATRRSGGKDPYLLSAYVQQGHDNASRVAANVLSTSRDPAVQVAALKAVGNSPSALTNEEIKVITGFLDEKNFHGARKAAAATLGKIQSPQGVQPLIDNIEDLVIGEAARGALLRLTGQKFWRDKGGWTTWWEENKATFKPEPMEQEAFDTLLAEVMKDMGEDQMKISFYEREITGKNILFLLDTSGSMGDKSAESGLPRIDSLKQELNDLVGRLDEQYSIGMVFFPHKTFPSRGIDKVDDRFRKKADSFIKDIEAAGGTPLGAAVEYAYEKVIPKSNIDTIYLLSDGSPSDTSTDELLQKLLGYNDRYDVTINCVSIGRTSSLLKAVAKESGGQYWEIL